MDISNVIQNFGFPAGISVILIYAVWYLFNSLQERYKEHEMWLCAKLEEITKTNQELATTNKSLSDVINRSLSELNSKLEHSCLMLNDIKSDLKK